MEIPQEEKDKLLNKFMYEYSEVEDIIMGYARRKKMTSYLEKWGNKPYSDSDHIISHMLNELLSEIEK